MLIETPCFCLLDLEHLLFAHIFEILGVSLETTQHSGLGEVFRKSFYLRILTQVIAAGVEVKDVYSWLCDCIQGLVEALFGGQVTAVREVVVKLRGSQGLD